MKKVDLTKALISINGNLSPDVIKNLSPDVINNLSLVNDLPVIPDQYAALLKEIEGNPAIYKQSTFGELNDAKSNVCESPMCIAGHQVHMAGKEGYKAKKEFGYATTAALVHLKAYPDAPVFNYMLTDNASGLLYIKMMAAFDNRKNKKQTFGKWYESAFKAAE